MVEVLVPCVVSGIRWGSWTCLCGGGTATSPVSIFLQPAQSDFPGEMTPLWFLVKESPTTHHRGILKKPNVQARPKTTGLRASGVEPYESRIEIKRGH